MTHPYIDNACAHNDHGACPGWCPYCEAPCVCGCGHNSRDRAGLPGGDGGSNSPTAVPYVATTTAPAPVRAPSTPAKPVPTAPRRR